MQILINLFVVLVLVLGGALIVAASLMRCRHCGKWHTDAAEEYLCEREHLNDW